MKNNEKALYNNAHIFEHRYGFRLRALKLQGVEARQYTVSKRLYPGTGNLDGTAPISKSMLSAVTTSLLLTNRL